MKKRDLFGLQQVFAEMLDLRSSVKFSYAIARNIKRVEDELDLLRAAAKPSPEFDAYEAERINLCEKYCEKDESGKSVMDGPGYRITGNREEFEKESADLRSKHEEVIQKRDLQVMEFNGLLDEDSDIELLKVDLDSFPKELTPRQMYVLSDMVKDEGKG